LDSLNGAAKLVGLLLDEGPSLLNGHLASVAMNLEGFELSVLVVVDGHLPTIGMPFCLAPEMSSWLIASQDRQRQVSSLGV
jgi:hypothetical protein